MRKFEITRGDTFAATCTYTDQDGAAIDLTEFTIASEMVRDDTRFAFTVAVIDAANGQFTLSASADETKALEIGTYKCDIEYTLGDAVSSSDVFRVSVKEDVTNAN